MKKYKKEIKPIGGMVDGLLLELMHKKPKDYSDNTKRIKMIYAIAFKKLEWDKKRTFEYIDKEFPHLKKKAGRDFRKELLHFSLGVLFDMMSKKEMVQCVCKFRGLERAHDRKAKNEE